MFAPVGGWIFFQGRQRDEEVGPRNLYWLHSGAGCPNLYGLPSREGCPPNQYGLPLAEEGGAF